MAATRSPLVLLTGATAGVGDRLLALGRSDCGGAPRSY